MCTCVDLPNQFQFGPSIVISFAHIPCLFLNRKPGLHNHHILRPAKSERQFQQIGRILIGVVEFPHTAQIARGETHGTRIGLLQIFGCCDSGAFFWSAADQFSNCTIQLHLGQSDRHQFVQFCVHNAIIDWLSNIHGFLLSGTKRQVFILSIKSLAGTGLDQRIRQKVFGVQRYRGDRSDELETLLAWKQNFG